MTQSVTCPHCHGHGVILGTVLCLLCNGMKRVTDEMGRRYLEMQAREGDTDLVDLMRLFGKPVELIEMPSRLNVPELLNPPRRRSP